MLILVATALLRFVSASHSLQFDEHASVYFSDQSYARLWSDWMLRETNPPLYYSILRAWRAIAGSSDWAIRVPTIVASLCAIVLLYALTRRIYGTTAAVIAAGLAGISGRHLYFAELARGYIFVLCAVLVAVGALVTISSSDAKLSSRRRALALYTVAATAAIYLHTTMILFPVFAFVAVIASDPARCRSHPRQLLPLIAANIAVYILSAWAIRIAALQLIYGRDNISAIGLADLGQIAAYSFKTLFLSIGTEWLPSLLAPFLAFLIIRFAMSDRQRAETRLLAALAGISLFALACIGMVVPIFVPRTIFWISGILSILLAGALAGIPAVRLRWTVLAIVVAALAIDMVRLRQTIEDENWNTPVQIMSRYPGALLLVQGEAMALLADSVCRRKLSVPCPYIVVAATVERDPYDAWGLGLYDGPKVPVTALPRYAAGRTVFLFRKQAFHNLPIMLHERGLGGGVPDNGPLLIGPLPASALGPR
jgi:4-amino-4-deoxy-L-arabinose transferase-like glycosyltransferase